MTIDRYQFKLQIDRLIATFGDRNFPEPRQKMIWDIVSGHNYFLVDRVVEGFIRKAKSAPLPCDFQEAVAQEEKISGNKKHCLGEIKPKEFAKCLDCGDSGFVRLIRLEDHEPWAKYASGSAPCHCEFGYQVSSNQKYKLGPQFGPLWKSSYKINSCYN